MQQAPEVVARIGEVRASRGGHAARIDADEDDAEPRSENIRYIAGRRVRFGHVPSVNHLFPQWGSKAPFPNGRRGAVETEWQLCVEWLPGGYAASTAASASSSSAISSSVRASMRASKSRRRSSPDTARSYRGRRGSIFTRVTVESQPPYKRT